MIRPALAAGETFDVERLLAPDAAIAAFFSGVTLELPMRETVALADANGRVLAVDVHADAAYPAAARSTMDGIAVASRDGDAVRRIVG